MFKQNFFLSGRKSCALFLAFVLAAPFFSPPTASANSEMILGVEMRESSSTEGVLQRGETNEIGSITFTAIKGKTEIMRLSLNITGTGDPKRLVRVQLYNEFGALVSTGKIQQNTILFTDLKRLTLNENETATLTIHTGLEPNAELGKTYGFEMKSADAVFLRTNNYAKQEASGIFPLQITPLPVIDAKMGTFLTAAFATESASRRYFPIAQEMNIASLELAAFGDDVTVNKIILIKNGDLKEKYLRKLWLTEDGDAEAVANFTLTEEGELIYDTLFTIKAGEKKLLQIGTTVPWEAGEMKNFFFEINPDKGISATSDGKKVPIIADASPLRTKPLTVISSAINMWRSWLNPQARNLKAGEKDVVLLEVEVQSTTTNINLDTMRVRIESGFDTLENVRLLKKPGLRLNSTKIEGTDFIFKSPGSLAEGKIENFQVIADVSKYAKNGEHVTVVIPKQDLATGIPTYAEEVRGNTFVIGEKKNSGNLQLEQSIRIQDVLRGSTDAPLMAITISADEGAVEIEKLRFTKTEYGEKGVFSNFQLRNASGSFQNKGKTEGNTITFSTPFGIGNTGSEILILSADVSDSGDKSSAIDLTLVDSSAIEASSLETRVPVTLTGRLPMKTLKITAIKPTSDTYLLVSGNAANELSLMRGQEDADLGSITFEAREEDMIVDRLLFTREGSLDFGLTDLRLKSNDGQTITGRLSDATLIFDSPLRLSANTRTTFTLLGTLQPNVPLFSDIRFALSGSDQIRMRVSGREIIPVYANFPLQISSLKVTDGSEACKQAEKKSVCGRYYSLAEGSPVFKTYPSYCELKKAKALFVREGTCENMINENDANAPVSLFSDVPVNHPYAKAINKLRVEGVLVGTGGGKFQPETNLTRAELLKLVVTARFDDTMTKQCIEQNAARSLAIFFSDVPSDAWFAPYVCVAKTVGWVHGYPDGSFHPDEPVAFAGAAKIIVNAFYPDAFVDGAPWFEPYTEFLAEENAIPPTVRAMSSQMTRGEAAELIWRIKEKITNLDSRDYDEKRHALE